MKEMVNHTHIQKDISDMDFEELIEFMQGRRCKAKIKGYREELMELQ